jgi:integrase/recombinase XerD
MSLADRDAGSPWSADLDDFMRHLALERAYSQNTCSSYARDVRDFLRWCSAGGLEPAAATPEKLEEYLWDLKSKNRIAPRSIFRKMEALKAFYRYLTVEGRVTQEPTRNFKMPHLPARIPQWLSVQEMTALLSCPPKDFHIMRTIAVVELFYASGIRISELLGLQLEALNLEQGWILVRGKGGKERMVPVHKRALRVLHDYIGERNRHFAGKGASSEVFLNKFGRKLSRVQIWKDINMIGRLAGIKRKLHPHLFRHTFASHLMQGGADLRSLQEMLGHASLATTQIYTHLERSDLKRLHEKYHPDA